MGGSAPGLGYWCHDNRASLWFCHVYGQTHIEEWFVLGVLKVFTESLWRLENVADHWGRDAERLMLT